MQYAKFRIAETNGGEFYLQISEYHIFNWWFWFENYDWIYDRIRIQYPYKGKREKKFRKMFNTPEPNNLSFRTVVKELFYNSTEEQKKKFLPIVVKEFENEYNILCKEEEDRAKQREYDNQIKGFYY